MPVIKLHYNRSGGEIELLLIRSPPGTSTKVRSLELILHDRCCYVVVSSSAHALSIALGYWGGGGEGCRWSRVDTVDTVSIGTGGNFDLMLIRWSLFRLSSRMERVSRRSSLSFGLFRSIPSARVVEGFDPFGTALDAH